MSVSGAWDLLSCYRKNRSAVGRPGLRQAGLGMCLARVKNVLLLIEGFFLGLLGALRDNDLGVIGSKEH